MTAIRGVPGAVDDVGVAYQNFIEADRAMIFDALGGVLGQQGIIRGFTMTLDVGSLSVTFAPGSAMIEERGSDIVGNERGYHVFNDVDTVVTFEAATLSSRVDAIVFAWADPQYGTIGPTMVVGPQIVVVQGDATAPTDTDIDTAVGGGGWFRFADVQIDVDDTEVNPANVTENLLARIEAARAKIVKNGQQVFANSTQEQVHYAELVFENRPGMGDIANNEIIIPEDGDYRLATQLRFAANNTGERAIRLQVNGSPVGGNACTGMSSAIGNFLNVVVEVDDLVTGDIISCLALQDSGGSLSSSADVTASWLSVVRIR